MPYFLAFFAGMRESQEDVIHLHDTDASTFGLFLDFIYDGYAIVVISDTCVGGPRRSGVMLESRHRLCPFRGSSQVPALRRVL